MGLDEQLDERKVKILKAGRTARIYKQKTSVSRQK